jgi:hypothetical protein
VKLPVKLVLFALISLNIALASDSEIITSKKLSRMKPIDIVKMLKKQCCNGVMFEPIKIDFWTEADLEKIKPFLGDISKSAPVVSTLSSISCRGKRYVSTVDREVQHLIRAFKEKKYPLSLCSTYDLHLNSSN